MKVVLAIVDIRRVAYLLPLVLGLFLVPVFWNPSFIHGFTHGKELLFKTIVLTTAVSLLVGLIEKKSINVKNIVRSPIFLLLLLQMCVYAITDVFSETPTIALYGTYSRGLGFIIELFLFAFLIYCSTILSEKNISGLFKIIFLSGLIAAFYSILQMAGFDLFFANYGTNIFDERSFGFSGNPSYFGQLMLLNVIIASHLFLSEKVRNLKIVYAFGVLIFLYALFISGTRAAIFGLLAAIVLILVKYWKSFAAVIRNHKAIFVIGLLVIGVFLTTLPQERYSLSNVALRSLNSRLEIWNGTVDLIKKKPILGYGGESFYVYFPEIITKKFLTLEENIDVSADRVHNEFLEVFFSHGIVAISIYLLILGVIAAIFFKTKNGKITVLALLIIANAVQNQFVFPDITINIIVVFCFAGIIALQVTNSDIKTFVLKKWHKCVAAVATIVLSMYIGFFTVYKPYMSQLTYVKSHNSVDYETVVNGLNGALSYTPYYGELWYELMFIDPSSMEGALSWLEKIEGNSGNVLAWKGNFYSDKDPQKASEFYTQALEKNPYHPNWIRAFADMLYDNGDFENALFLYDKYLEAIPDFWKFGDDLENHTPEEQEKYETLLKHTPFLLETLEKIDQLMVVTGNTEKN